MRALILLALMSIASPASADHPGEQLDEVMAAKESAFEPIDDALTELSLQAADGSELDLRELKDTIVVLSFVTEDCGSACIEQQELLIEVQAAINVTPMREMVAFVTVAAPGTFLGNGWDPENWQLVTTRGKTTAQFAVAIADHSQRPKQSPMAHVIDRGSRHAAIFHGADFGRINMVQYINGLTNAHPHETGLFKRIFEWLPW